MKPRGAEWTPRVNQTQGRRVGPSERAAEITGEQTRALLADAICEREFTN